VKPHALDARDNDREESKDETTEPQGPHRPRFVPAVGKDIWPRASGAEAACEKGTLFADLELTLG
jgi:hypothetical protein